MAGFPIDPNWHRISRWSLLGAIVMVLWLLWPVAKCSFKVFKNEPLDEATPVSDGTREEEQPGFFSRMGSGMKVCYARTPLLGQEAWKRNVLFGLAGLSALTYVIARLEKRSKKTYGS